MMEEEKFDVQGHKSEIRGTSGLLSRIEILMKLAKKGAITPDLLQKQNNFMISADDNAAPESEI